jgi:broad specificity phosphatase PhoE
MRSKEVLVVGHTNTVPAIVLGLSGQTIAPIADTDFDNIYIIKVKRCSGTNRTLAHITYGISTQ